MIFLQNKAIVTILKELNTYHETISEKNSSSRNRNVNKNKIESIRTARMFIHYCHIRKHTETWHVQQICASNIYKTFIKYLV